MFSLNFDVYVVDDDSGGLVWWLCGYVDESMIDVDHEGYAGAVCLDADVLAGF